MGVCVDDPWAFFKTWPKGLVGVETCSDLDESNIGAVLPDDCSLTLGDVRSVFDGQRVNITNYCPVSCGSCRCEDGWKLDPASGECVELDAVPAKARNEGGTPVQRTGHESSSLMLPSPGASVSPNNSAGTGKGAEKGTESPRVSEMLVVHDVYDQAFTEHLPKIDRRSSWYKFPPTSIKTSASSFLYRPDIKVRLAGFICCGLMSHVSCLKLLVTCYLFRSVSLLSSAPEILDFPQIYTGTRPYHTHRPSQNEKRLLYS